MNKTPIEWTDWSWNPIVGCTGCCPWCYARRQARRFIHRCADCGAFRPHLHAERLDEPIRKRRPQVIFTCSMGELFDPQVPDAWRHIVFGVMALAEHHTFVVLTKRPETARLYLRRGGLLHDWVDAYRLALPKQLSVMPLRNLALGVSATNQKDVDERVPALLDTPVAIRFVSLEPLCGPVDLEAPGFLRRDGCHTFANGQAFPALCTACGGKGSPRLDGVIVGGMTGPGSVPMHPDWVRAIRDQCAAAAVPFFFKSWGDVVFPAAMTDEVYADVDAAVNLGGLSEEGEPGWRVGKKRSGRILDGRTHDDLPWRLTDEPERGSGT
jgi:protein gp37